MSAHDPAAVPKPVLALIALAIRLYPPPFRAAYGAEMLDVFASRYRRRRSGAPWVWATTALVGTTFFNLMRNAFAERARGSTPPEVRMPPSPDPRAGDGLARNAGKDIRYGLRTLRRQPGFALVAVLTLGIGVGANTAIFSLVNGVLLRALPYETPDRLVTVWASNAARGVDRWGASLHDYTDWRERSDVFQDLGAFNRNTINLGGIERPQRIDYAQVTPSVFTTLGVAPQYGRTFTPEENVPGNDMVLVVSHAFWRAQLDADPDAVGTTLTIDGRPMTVVGVMPEGFAFPDASVRAWKPFGMRPADEGNRGGRWVRVVGRLKDNMPLARAQASLSTLGTTLAAEFPETNTDFSIYVEPMLTTTVSGVQRTLFILWGTAGFVLLIAASNIANLLLARATSRQRELAMRAALGASRGRLVSQLLAESVPLAVAGAGLGIVLAWVAVDTLPGLSGGRIPRLDEVTVDASVMVYSLVTSLIVTLMFSALPARRTARIELTPALKEGTKGSEGRERFGTRNALVVVQMALAVVVITGAGLLVRSFVTLTRTDPGFDPSNVLSVRVAPSWQEITERPIAAQIFGRMLEGIRTIPGVTSASATNVLPLAGNRWGTRVQIEGRPQPSDAPPRSAFTRVVMPGYHETMGIPRLQGRALRAADDAGAPFAVVINRAAAEAWWPEGSPIGQRIEFDGVFRSVVGIVDNVRHSQLSSPGAPLLYVSFAQGRFGHFQDWGMTFVVRTERDPESMAEEVRTRMAEIAPDIPLYDVASLDRVIWDDVSGERFTMVLLGVFGGVALVLSSVGVYSVMAYAVGQRTREIGVRVALGARAPRVIRMVLGGGLTMAAVGLAFGGLGSLWVGRLLESMLYETSPLDPVTYVGVIGILLGTATAACLIPAVRATRVDPVKALRAD